ncbi:MAG: glycosyltransferase [Haliscomenobacter sp.]|uniref:glycosyltransferase n=1 Tax=Haliscomenobacter sp. TaxID=2717303 RepID=UPI0029AD64F5|nr:glycosyltransferase [Haliscomenobacter sp.]MDX2068170.1 glycosyltransferase [Haliscomenobacter sp.]
MKLVFTVTNDLCYDQRMQRICGTLSAEGHEVTLVGRLRKTSPLLPPAPYRQVRLACWFEKGKLFYLEYNFRLFWWLLLQKSFDVYTGIDLDTIMPCLGVARLKGKKCYYDAHEYFSEVPEVVGRPLTKWIWEMVARIGIPHVDKAYTVGPALAQIFQQRYGIPFEVVRNMPFQNSNPSSTPPPLNSSTPPIILYQGVLNAGRGLETAIAAMQKIEGAVLWLAGEGDLSQELRQLAKDLQVECKVRFLGYLNPVELRSVTQQASIGLNLLENRGLSYFYSLANKAFDYVQAGVPSIQMNFPEYLALQEEHRVFYLINRLEVEVLVQAIEHLLGDGELYLALEENCRKAAVEWCWEMEKVRLVEMYR